MSASFKCNLELNYGDTTVYKIEGGYESLSNDPTDDLHANEDNSSITINELTPAKLAAGSPVKPGSTLTGTIQLYAEDLTNTSDNFPSVTYIGNIKGAVIWRAGLRCKVKMEEYEE